MRRLACALLMVIILFSGLSFVSNVQASTPVSGTLTSDITWTKANSPYYFTGNVAVVTNVTLTIAPGVTVNFGNYNLEVNGTLIARGTISDKIVFLNNSTNVFFTRQIMFTRYSTSWNEQSGQGCIIENAQLKSISIIINNGSPKIANNEFDATILISGGSPIITNNNMILRGDGINIMSGSPVISYNTLRGNGFAMGIYGSGNVTISKNIISKFNTGIKVYSGAYQITENSITDCYTGIEVGTGAMATIQKNLINNNGQNGISGGSGYINSNTITNNRVGIHNPTTGSIINNNNILGNSENSITAAKADVDATDNWWGTTDIQAINRTIYDSKIDYTLGKVTFVPILTAPNPSAPAIPAITPTPTFTPNPTTAPTAAPTEQPPTFTPTPTRDPDAPKSGVDQASPLLSLNLLVIALLVPLILAWLIVILDYTLKSRISKFRASNQK